MHSLGIPKRRNTLGPSSASHDTPLSASGGIKKGFLKQSKMKMMDLDESATLSQTAAEEQKRRESEKTNEKERKLREKEAEVQARKDAVEAKRLEKLALTRSEKC